jgi:hypothetical protein
MYSIAFYSMAHQPLAGQSPLIIGASQSHSHTSFSVGLLWMNDQSDTETSTWQHTTLTRDRNTCPRRDSNPQPLQASGRKIQCIYDQIFHKWGPIWTRWQINILCACRLWNFSHPTGSLVTILTVPPHLFREWKTEFKCSFSVFVFLTKTTGKEERFVKGRC